MRTYIAGAMRGHEFFNFPAFDAKRDELLAKGYEVVSPADIDRDHGFNPFTLPEDYDWNTIPAGAGTRHEILRRDVAELLTCDSIYLLPGWEESVGARAEASLARWAGMYIMYAAGTKPPTAAEISVPLEREQMQREAFEQKNEPNQQALDDYFTGFSQPEVKPSNPKDNIGSKKAGLSAVPCAPLYEVGAVLNYGGCKYGKHNWRSIGVRASVYYDAALRHLMSWWEGEDTDESGLPHLAHAIAGLMVYRDAEIQGMTTDDRPISTGNPSERLTEAMAVIRDRFPNPVPPFTQKPL